MTYHNPAKIGLSLVGPNYKLLTTDQLDKPLPEGAEYWRIQDSKWVSSGDIGCQPTYRLTYRIPLSLSDKIKARIAADEELLATVEAVEKGAEFEVRSGDQDSWTSPSPNETHISWYLEPCRWLKWQVRIKPVPHTIPWMLETRPLGEVWVKKKTEHHKPLMGEFQITAWGTEKIFIEHYGWHTYSELHDHWQQRSGEVCGERVTI